MEVHASGWVSTELEWPSTWTDRADRDRTPSILGHELAGVVSALDDVGGVDLVFDVIGGDSRTDGPNGSSCRSRRR